MGALASTGDVGTVVSGLVFDNIGRWVAGGLGVMGNFPIVLFSERTKQPGEIDPQDLPVRQKIKHIWKCWRYPFEFASFVQMGQCFAMAFISGPDTGSAVGEALNVDALVSSDTQRVSEVLLGSGGMVAASISLVREAEKQPEHALPPKGFFANLVSDFCGLEEFCGDRVDNLASEGWRLDKGISNSFNGACAAIAVAGPNRISAKSWNTLLYPWAIESALRHDWGNVAAAGFYRVCNYYYEHSSKRATDVATLPVAPALAA